MKMKRRPTVEELEAILARPDEDFIKLGRVRVWMRPLWFPRWLWKLLRA